MSARSGAKGSAGALKDKWKMKKWFSIYSPKVFGEVSLGSTPAFDVSQTMGRKVETTLYDLTGDFSTVYVHLYFKVVRNEGERLFTEFAGHELSRDYVRSLVRRKSSKINKVVDITTKDGFTLRVKTLALTAYRVHREQATTIRKIMEDVVKKTAEGKTFDEFVQEMIFGNLANNIFNEAKKIAPLRKAEIEKSKVLFAPLIKEGKQTVESSAPGSG
ncbi:MULTISPECIES: 30S ribosomal protein S3ae [Metallosphaera]|uniref:Small ribosomal subunit protein eS1 n=3 Tax=Metallosphaera TaxID=41980 RepID=A4YCU2_METS5|nr:MULTISPECIES: 30S ribosomal protein S3ae [Metallosphaera]ABP94244.1 SSU ribosomal protein S3AE [Metallosphaera sedula DSM 5348]AIM26231.1 SSU ribosomal protein S3AE [Metallosphaera sedula]AKV73251.1 30S ribosomal protein S3Ae [Metallosphaera sedula]AKV75495.1 30S ribosomal protein S3Ae [Metallosphaera sedula]AKV77741.1 30S ribosomal protein S3Ae [Metallosphaera sedula]